MANSYVIAKRLADYVDEVVTKVAIRSDLDDGSAIDAARNRVFEHLKIVLQNAIEGNATDELAEVLAEAV